MSSGRVRGESHAQTGLSNTVFVDANGANFHLSANTSPGMSLESPYDVDADGAPRATWSRGAYEY